MSEKNNNPFKNLETNEEVPDVLKKRVMDDIRFARFLGDMAELFVTKLTSTVVTMIGPDQKAALPRDHSRENGKSNNPHNDEIDLS